MLVPTYTYMKIPWGGANPTLYSVFVWLGIRRMYILLSQSLKTCKCTFCVKAYVGAITLVCILCCIRVCHRKSLPVKHNHNLQ